MRNRIKLLLFGSSYTPLFLLLLLNNLNYNPFTHQPVTVRSFFLESQKNPLITLFLVMLIIVSNGMLWYVLKHIRNFQPTSYKVEKAATKSGEALNYIVTYIIPFLAFDLSKTKDVLSLLVLLGVMGLIFIGTNLLYTNPMLSIFGFRVYEVETPTQTQMMLITKNARKNKGREFKAIHIDDNIYLEA